MTNAQTSNKAKRESVFRTFMALSREGMSADQARQAIAADLGVDVQVIAALNRTVVGR